MAKRDPLKAALNKEIERLTETVLKPLAPHVMRVLGHPTVESLHGRIGGKNAQFIDVKQAVISSPSEYVRLWISGFLATIDSMRPFCAGNEYVALLRAMQTDPDVETYTLTFLRRTYLRNSNALSRVRPEVHEAEVWLGNDRACYGLLVTPRFVNGDWENDKSEIRHFPKTYFTVGHVLETGFVVPGAPNPITFTDVAGYLAFFQHTLVRASGSPHEAELAKRYVNHVLAASEPERVPLLLPELRYAGRATPHEYRLDFAVIDPYSMQKVGFELSPWSTHGNLTGTKSKTQKQINEEARENFEGEMKKVKDYFRRHDIFTLIYTDTDLRNPAAVFADVQKHLVPNAVPLQLELHSIDELRRYKI